MGGTMSAKGSTAPSPGSDTPTRILDTAEALVQQRGFNSFSYGEVAGELGITRASLHYHYPGKAILGRSLIERYAERFGEELARIDAGEPGPAEKLRAYVALYSGVLSEGRMCLCGMLAAEFLTLPEELRDPLLRFFDDNEAWLAAVLEEGRSDGAMQFAGPAGETARMLIGGLEGAMLIARPYGDTERFRRAAAGLLSGLAMDA